MHCASLTQLSSIYHAPVSPLTSEEPCRRRSWRAEKSLIRTIVPKSKLPAQSRFARRHPKTYLGLHASIGLLLAALSTWAFVAIADEVPEKGWMERLDMAVTTWQTHGTERGEAILVGVSFLGMQVLAVILLAAAALVIVIGYARIYLGVHYLSDVVAGFAAGFIWLIVCITGYRFAERRRVGQSGPDKDIIAG
jgi:hypothetical protein